MPMRSPAWYAAANSSTFATKNSVTHVTSRSRLTFDANAP